MGKWRHNIFFFIWIHRVMCINCMNVRCACHFTLIWHVAFGIEQRTSFVINISASRSNHGHFWRQTTAHIHNCTSHKINKKQYFFVERICGRFEYMTANNSSMCALLTFQIWFELKFFFFKFGSFFCDSRRAWQILATLWENIDFQCFEETSERVSSHAYVIDLNMIMLLYCVRKLIYIQSNERHRIKHKVVCNEIAFSCDFLFVAIICGRATSLIHWPCRANFIFKMPYQPVQKYSFFFFIFILKRMSSMWIKWIIECMCRFLRCIVSYIEWARWRTKTSTTTTKMEGDCNLSINKKKWLSFGSCAQCGWQQFFACTKRKKLKLSERETNSTHTHRICIWFRVFHWSVQTVQHNKLNTISLNIE